ncbi:hypothetical protein evm_007619 [Chilo suppressalis]|nr:hypothetical protein evm_007619 [Chilo suppressalis]
MSEEPLQYMPMERWEELEKVFATDWPRSISAQAALQTQKQLETLGLGYGFKVYCPYGDPQNGIVAMNKKGELMEIIVQCPDDDTTTLKTSLFTTKLIDWSDVILIPFMPENIRRIVAEVAPQVNVEMVAEDTVPNQMFIFDFESKPLFDNNSIPEDVTIQPVSENDLEIVNSTWRNSYNGSMWLFDTLAKANFGYGVFKNHELVSWVFVNEVGALTHLYTLNEHRRMGFAEILLKQVCNTRLRENKNVFAYCRKGNTNACKLYEKLDFKAHHEVRWCFLKPKMELSK